MNAYAEYGKGTRDDYLLYLSEEFGVDLDIVSTLADILGPSEDFDGLVVALEEA